MSRRRSTRNTKKPTKTKIIPSKKLKINRKTSKMVSPKEKVKSRRPSRMSFGEEHMGQLEEAFEVCNYPDVYMREEIAQRINIGADRIRVWFSNRRAKHRKEYYKELQKIEASKIASTEKEKKNLKKEGRKLKKN